MGNKQFDFHHCESCVTVNYVYPGVMIFEKTLLLITNMVSQIY